jgi:hypothetical protein
MKFPQPFLRIKLKEIGCRVLIWPKEVIRQDAVGGEIAHILRFLNRGIERVIELLPNGTALNFFKSPFTRDR